MPPEQDNTISGGPTKVMVTNRTEKASVHAKLPGSTNNVNPCLEDGIPDQDQQQATPLRFSILSESLQPVTLKVRTYA